jgi:nucleoside-diphosphate-sugar epimerase/predicted dehydrogenase
MSYTQICLLPEGADRGLRRFIFMRILVLGTTSFASAGVVEALARFGHDVVQFQRGPEAAAEGVVTGSLDRLDESPFLAGNFDTVINYIVLKDYGVEANAGFARNLCRFCRNHGVGHLIHLSSISAYRASSGRVAEDSPIEQHPERKGPYGAIKTVVDHVLLQDMPKDVKLTLLRPGFILGPGLMNPIIGTAIRMPWNRLLVIGNPESVMPLTSREIVSRAVAKIVETPPESGHEVVMLVDQNSPPRREFLRIVCQRLGAGTGVSSIPVAMWWLLAVGGEVVARLIGQRKIQVYLKLSSRLGRQYYDSTASAGRLGFSLAVDWPQELTRCLPGQQASFALPAAVSSELGDTRGEVNFIGFGRIVLQKHLPALRRLAFNGHINGYDMRSFESPSGHLVRDISTVQPAAARLHVIATPGRYHVGAADALATVPGAILIEKPACYGPAEFQRLASLAAGRSDPVAVCHNYRFKSNVLGLEEILRAYNPGRLLHVHVDFSSPPAAGDSAAWARRERESRTLLMDYSIHFLDLACMFSDAPWQTKGVRYGLDARGDTQWIRGTLEGEYGVDFLLRQGFAPRRAKICYAFQNYTASLDFFPDTFAVNMSGDNPWYYRRQGRAVMRATISKIRDKITGRDSDRSHDRMLCAMLNGDTAVVSAVTISALSNFYTAVFGIAESVYEIAKK